ncbi:hypothetical protein H7F10_07190 [Acidithiobacillus sp. HP-6]|uniref:hypothetical protein n=1 Tax=unclassified Acidithiobacillus TaxID=2614800 RepID=UPI00187AAB64|nr:MULTISPECIES: hypothetical protein [unclassified Acidithiobacillus]MBE7562737.1 hypothetical protein [Acidithiobacillus sp. HP-6]MBE7570467.1 hypothetical protein [Acidithiobacillus sp. HP-2]
MDDILWFFNATILLSMAGVGVLLFLLGWFFFRENEKIGDKLGIVGGIIIIIAEIIAGIGTNYNVPESWLRNLPVAEKVMMRHYIETKHRPISIFAYREIQARYYIKTHAKVDKERQDKDVLKKMHSPAIAKQLKAIGD